MAVSSFLSFTTFTYCAISLAFLVSVHGGDFIPERVCGTLYSQNDFQGNTFTLNDFDYTSNTSTEYRASLSGWLNTNSIRVEKDCSMHVCSEMYFQGTCHLLNENITELSSLISQIGSANCTCARVCNCEDVIVPEHEYGRMYLNGGCQLCDTGYIKLSYGDSYFGISQYVQTIKIRRGCNLTLYGDTRYKGTSNQHSEEIVENNFNTFKSFDVSCNESAYTPPHPKPQATSYPPQIRLPETSQALLQLAFTNDSMARHPGIKAALKSLQNGKSWRNAYILLIGTGNPNFYFGIQGCELSNNGKIRECRISQPLDKLGISNSEIRIIYYNSNYGLPIDVEDDSAFIASLDEYLSNHEELKHAIPNAVVLSWNIGLERQLLKRQRRVINALRTRVLEEKYSNLIFYIDLDDSTDFRSANTRVANIVNEIKSNWTFPKPNVVIIHGDWDSLDGHKMYVNGFRKMFHGEYWPLNVIQRLQAICRLSGDPLGDAIFTKMHVKTWDVKKVSYLESNLVSKTHSLVEYYRRCSIENPVSACANATQRPRPVSQFREQAAINHKMLQNFAGLHLKTQKLEEKLAKLEASREADVERIKNDVVEKIRVDLNKLFEW